MITTHLMGGLGNQLFQIFCAWAMALRLQTEFVVLTTYQTNFNQGRSDRPTYWDTILSGVKNNVRFIRDIPNMIVEKEPTFEFRPIKLTTDVINGRGSLMINGYYQSEKYFRDKFMEIYSMLDIQKKRQDVLKKMVHMCNITETDEPMKNSISMHFRLGDYKGLQHYHPIMTFEYYNRSLREILNSFPEGSLQTPYTVYYFCEDGDVDTVMGCIQRLSQEFGDRLVFVRGGQGMDDWEQMLLMSCCNHHIIGNSSFSWWGAYFNTSPTKVVCYPSVWFGAAAGHNTRDLCPDEWRRVEV